MNCPDCGEVLWPQPSASHLIEYLDKALGKGKYSHFMPSSFSYDLLEHIPKIAKAVHFFRFYGSTRIPGIFSKERSIGTHQQLSIFDFKFKRIRVIAFNWCYPREGIWTTFFFPHGQLPLVIDLIKQLLQFQKRKKEIHLYGRKWIPVEKLDVSHFVVPSIVQRLFDLEVAPQLESKSIHNHALLYSPPGYGKTAYIRYLCKKYLDWTFIIVDPSSISKPYEVFDIFGHALAFQPAIVFFEDIDTLGRHRGQITEYNPFLGALLSAIDGLETYMGIYVIASTNNPQAVDPGLRRAGRLGLHIPFRYTRPEIIKILNNYLGTDFSFREASFITAYGPSQVRSIAKSAIGKARLQKISLNLGLVKETAKALPKESTLVTDFTPLPMEGSEPEPDTTVERS